MRSGAEDLGQPARTLLRSCPPNFRTSWMLPNPTFLALPGGHKRRGSSVQEFPPPSCCRGNYPAPASSRAANIVIFEKSCASHTVKVSQLAHNGNKVDEQIFPGSSLVSQGKDAFHCLHIQANYEYIEMRFFRLKLWFFKKKQNRPEHLHFHKMLPACIQSSF